MGKVQDRAKKQKSRWFRQTVLLTAVVAGLTTLMVAFHASSTVASMFYLVLLVAAATRSSLRLSLYTALICILAFDYFFLPPYHTLRIHGLSAWVVMACFVASSMLTERVADAARRQADRAEKRRSDVERLYALSQEMMLHEDPGGLIGDLPRMMEKIFGLESVALYVRDGKRFYSTRENLPIQVRETMADLPTMYNFAVDIADGHLALSLMQGLRPVGALAWKPDLLSLEVSTAVSAQVAVAVTRALALELSSRLEAGREAERLRTALIDSLTHELKTPLTAIRAASSTLVQAETLDEESQRDLAQLIDEEASHLDALIGEAVEMAQIDAHAMKVTPVAVDVHALLDQVVEESRKLLGGRKVFVVPPPTNETIQPVWLDQRLLGRVFHHLIENAVRYTQPGATITLSARRGQKRVEFAVEDNGPGIDPADLPFIFEKFYRGKQSKFRRKGSGMGLAIVRAMLEAHGGGIEVSSELKQGTLFRFWVPLVAWEAKN